MPCVIWLTGLPGSGKSTIASKLKERVPEAEILRMDDFRRIVTPVPSYSDDERELVYRGLVFAAKILRELGHTVIIDATGNKRTWRKLARELIPDFLEIYLRCPLALCMKRENKRIETHGAPKGIYKKGMAGAPVPGVQVPYEEPRDPDLVIDTEKESPEGAAEKIVQLIRD